MRESPTTCTGYVNRNGQVAVRNTRIPGTDKNQYVYQLACSHCGHVYGANGSDIHLRLCPNCQGGAPGLILMNRNNVNPEVWLSTKTRVKNYLEMESAQNRQSMADFIHHRFLERYVSPLKAVEEMQRTGF